MPALKAFSTPRKFGASAYSTAFGYFSMQALARSAASAICGIALGLTKDVTSICVTPASNSLSIKSELLLKGHGICLRFCQPSRGPRFQNIDLVCHDRFLLTFRFFIS